MPQRENHPTQPTDKLDTTNPPNGLSDLEKLKQTFYTIGIKYDIFKYDRICEHQGYRYNQKLKIDEGCGYGGFYTEFYFLDGKFVTHGCWE